MSRVYMQSTLQFFCLGAVLAFPAPAEAVGITMANRLMAVTSPIVVTNIGNTFSNGSNSLALTTGGGGVPAGRLIVVGVIAGANSGATNNSTVTDSAGNTYTGMTQAINGSIVGLTVAGWIFYTYNTQALAPGTNITFTSGGAGVGSITLTAFYATGILNAADPLDAAVTATQSAGSGNPFLTSGTPAKSGELMVGFVAAGANFALGTYTQDTANGWRSPPSLNTGYNGYAEVAGGTLVNKNTATKTFSPTGINDPYAAWILGFKP